MNLRRLSSLTYKESHRFLKVWQQTVLSPMMTGILYFTVFGAALSTKIGEFDGVPYIAFIVPGLAMMQSTNNALQNPSSSLMIAKYQGTLIDLLLTPLTPGEKTWGYALGGMFRGMLVAVTLYAVAFLFVDGLIPQYPLFLLAVFALSNLCLSAVGTLAGIWGKSFDQFSAITNFIILPLIFLGGVFYSISALPPLGQTLTLLNPFYYMVDLARYAQFGTSNTDPFLSLGILLVLSGGIMTLNYWAFATGWRMKE